MEVGSFFEIYAIPDDDIQNNFIGSDIYNVCELLNIQVTKRNKSITEVNKDNYLMAGFPNHAVRKFVDILIDNNFIVVLVEQVTPPPKIVRKPTHIYSPSTNIENIKTHHTNYMMVIYIEKIRDKHNDYMHVVGWSIFDPSTGISYTNEITTEHDFKLLLDELYRIILQYDPKEVVILSLTNTVDSEYVYNYIKDHRYVLNKLNNMDPMYTKLKFQKTILRKVFDNIGFLSEIEYLHLEFKPFALISYVYLLQFAYEHNETLLLNIRKPVITYDVDDQMLILAYNAVNQLNIIGGSLSIESIFNNCTTAIGKRFFKQRLLNPITNEDELNDRYEKTAVMYQHKIWEIATDLMNVKDIERLIRKAVMHTLHPHQFGLLYDSLVYLNNVFTKLNTMTDIFEQFFKSYESIFKSKLFINFELRCNDCINFSELRKYNLDSMKSNIFQKGYSIKLDNLYETSNIILDKMKSKVHEVDINWLKLDHNDRDGYHYTITKKRWDTLKLKKHKITEELTYMSSNMSQIKLSNIEMKDNNRILSDLDSNAKSLSLQLYDEFVQLSVTLFNETLFQPYITLLEIVDFHINCAKNSYDYNLVKPIIDNNYKNESYFNFDEVRHPLIEVVQKDLQYTSNSLTLGEDTELGLILYGVNASGKSSFMKSVGVNIILAQSGMYVSSKKMIYRPYKRLFTRILSSDNILKGMSTFANEIYEIRNILEKTDKHSIVIGDELCSGTESISAIAIVMAGIESLITSQTTFIFATHLHELTNLKQLKKLVETNKILIKHLKVTYDESSDSLIYDRTLSDGQGTSLYGLEVCKAMDMKSEFIHNASQIRHELVNNPHTLISNKTSKYNSNVVMDNCKICQTVNGQVETHHIKFQKYADKNGIIDKTFHKNSEFNLIPLCLKCHEKVHTNTICIRGWIQTSKGKRLDYVSSESSNYDKDQIFKIRETYSIRQTLTELANVGVIITRYKLMKILKER